MNIKHLSTAALCATFATSIISCSSEETVSNDNLNVVSTLDPEDCSDKTEGTLSFVKPEATMYVCSDGEWIAMNDHEAIKYRCDYDELKDDAGFAIVCDGDTIGIVNNGKDGSDGKDGKKGTNGTNGKDGVSVDTAAVNKSFRDAMSSASAKNQKDIEEAIKNLSSASSKLDKDIDNKFDKAYSSWSEELEEKSCTIIDTVRNVEKSVITVKIRCGDAETTMEIPFTAVNENLANVYNKHVVVRFPVQTSKEKADYIYEEIWKNFKGGDNAELTVMDLDEKFAPNGKVFLQDLFASASKSFVTVEETNEKTVEYKVVRLEGDIDVTNLSTPIVQLRVKLKMTDNTFSAFGGYGSNATDVIYSAYADLSEESDTIVIDFLTDYKAARVKNLVGAGSEFAAASKQANKELADALYLEHQGSEEYPSFEHYVPEQIGLAENFNSIVWVMALLNQNDKTPGFNSIYNAFRKVFAEKGNFNTAVNTTYAGKNRSMYFVDYLALLMDAYFYKMDMGLTAESDIWNCTDAINYTIVQKGFIDVYKLDESSLVDFTDENGYTAKVFKSEVQNGYFRYFEFVEDNKVWYPIAHWASAVAAIEKGACNAKIENTTFFYSFEDIDENVICKCENGKCYWLDTNVCLGHNERDAGYRYDQDDGIVPYVCVETKVCSDNANPSTCTTTLIPKTPGAGTPASSSSSNEVDLDEALNDQSSIFYLGACNENNIGDKVLVDEKNIQLSTTTEKAYWACNGQKWVRLSEEIEAVQDELARLNQNNVFHTELYFIDGTSDVQKQAKKLINMLCNLSDYKRAEGLADPNAFVVEVSLFEGEAPKTFVASETRRDWHEVSVNDTLGYCNDSLMINQTELKTLGEKNYKCNYITGGSEYYAWILAGSRDENKELGICTTNRLGEVVIVDETYYKCDGNIMDEACRDNPNADGCNEGHFLEFLDHEPNSSTSTDWITVDKSQYVNEIAEKKFGSCAKGDEKKPGNETTAIADLKDFEGMKLKCAVPLEGFAWDGAWVDASIDAMLGEVCNTKILDEETKDEQGNKYLCMQNESSKLPEWVKEQ